MIVKRSCFQTCKKINFCFYRLQTRDVCIFKDQFKEQSSDRSVCNTVTAPHIFKGGGS